ncbi:MAG: DUF1552 domain-containing protein [Planctomycetota bacterium]
MLDRRTMLRAGGISLALPLLESMTRIHGADGDAAPKRMVFLCNTLGLHPPSLWPGDRGSSLYLDLLKEHRDDFTLFGGLSHANQLGRQAHDSEMTWLTAAAKPGMDGFRNTISVDQVAAAHLGYSTRFPSIVLGTHLEQSQSYTSGGVMIPAETSPAKLFAKLFLQGRPREIRLEKHRLEQGKSILDELKSQTRAVRRRASKSDHHLLDDYLESVRSSEKGIGERHGWLDKPKPKLDVDAPKDVTDVGELVQQIKLMLDLIPLIVQTDSARVISLMIQDHGRLKIAGVSEPHHILSHHGQDRAKIDQLQRIESQIVGRFGGLIAALKSKRESSGTLLDTTSVLFGSNLGNANSHDTKNLPIFLAGGGQRRAGYVEFEERHNTQLSDLYLAMLHEMGIPSDSFGQSKGALSW